MSPADEPQHVTIRGTEDLLSLVPFLLGYRPDEHLVLVVLDGARVSLTAAMPLSALADGSAHHSIDVALSRVDDPEVLLACWSAEEQDALDALGRAEVWVGPDRVLDSAVVTPQRWWSRRGDGPGGRTADLASSRAATEAVVRGLACAPDRAGVAALVAGPDEDDDETRRAFRRAESRLVEMVPAAWDELAVRLLVSGADDPLALALEDLALLAVMSHDPVVRERMWLAVGRRSAVQHERLWLRVVAATPQCWAYAPLLVLGFAAWQSGRGALLSACLERAQHLGPPCPTLELLQDIAREALPPEVWEQVRAAHFLGTPMRPVA